ncbi:MAG: hypothetical protein HC927_12840 [Deltaproteobacteria bacterium]|nr:hypothetical protein [Deltaproteobacteria bacterium]
MLEIIVLVIFAKKLAEIAQNKGQSRGWAALGVAGWIVGEILGGVIGFIVLGDGFGPYMFALLGAALGAGVAYMIVNNLSAAPGSLEAELGDPNVYSHADPNNIYSPPGYGKRDQ